MPILSKTLTVCVLALTMSILPIVAAEDKSASPDALNQVVEAERAFSRTCGEVGIRKSFLQFFADDSTIFAPEPKNGKKFYTAYQDKGRKLIWEPIFATIASSGELGVTTGPWEMQTSMTDAKPIAFGDFVSVWKKQRDGSWKVVVDVGIDHPQPSEAPEDITLAPPNDAPRKEDVDLARNGLVKAETELAEMMREGAGSAVIASASEEVRVFREDSLPAVGKDAARLMLTSDGGKMTRKVSGSGMSVAGDLVYRVGSYASERPNASEHGYFLSIWQAQSGGEWKLIVDLQKKEPLPKKK
ncbi:MAG: hypothetical protein ABJB69_02975 [Spartobacteria bacterium]